MAAIAYPRTQAAAQAKPRYERLARRLAAPFLAVAWLLEIAFFGGMALLVISGPPGAQTNTELSSDFAVVIFCLVVLVAFLGGTFIALWPSQWPLWQLKSSAWLNETLAGRLGRGRFGVSRQHATVAASLVALQTNVAGLKVDGSDTVAGILAGKLATLRKEVVVALSALEGVDGQTESDFGQRFLNKMGLEICDLWERRSQLAAALEDYVAAALFDTPEGHSAALDLVTKRIGS